MPCRCSQVPGHLIGALPRSAGFGGFGRLPPARLPRSAGFGAVYNPFAVTQAIKPVVVSAAVAQNFAVAAQAIAQGSSPSPTQAVNIIKTANPPAPFQKNLPAPSRSGNKSVSNLSGMSASVAYGTTLRGLGDTSTAVSGVSAVASAIPVYGAAISAIIGIVGGLFGKKKVIPKISQADITQAQTWYSQYAQIAGSVVGRNFSATNIQDLMTAAAVMDPGFWGQASSGMLSVPAVAAFPQQLQQYLNDFFTAIAAASVGSTVTLHDDPSVLGHAKTNMNETYSFTNPGVNAPSYILGPLFAQYMYMTCAIWYPPPNPNCMGYLTAPMPQLLTDVLDWFRSSHPAWDTPQPNVVTGTDLSIAAPSSTAGSGGALTFTAPQIASGASASQVNTALQATAPTTPIGVNAASSVAASGIVQPVGTSSGSITGYSASGQPIYSSSATNLPTLQKAGFNWIEIALLVAVAIPLAIGMKAKPSHRRI